MNIKRLISEAYLDLSAKFINRYPLFFHDDVNSKVIPVLLNNAFQFYLYDYGLILRSRAASFSTKEPETIDWINNMNSESDCFFDVGANIGIFSLYAASKKIQTLAFEPQSFNYALLTKHIFLNDLTNYLTAYCVSLDNNFSFSQLNMFNASTWGTANSTFGRCIDSQGALRDDFNLQQGSISIELDCYVEFTKLIPSHLKIDVDGNELLVLQGATRTLSNSKLRSILIELTTTHPEFSDTISLIESNGFTLDFQGKSRKNTSNYIFYR